MTTPLYLHASVAIEPKPNIRQSTVTISKWIASTLGGGQDSAGAIYPLDMTITPGSDNTQSIRETSAELGYPYYGWYKAWISPTLEAQTILKFDSLYPAVGLIGVYFDWNEGNSAHNTFPRIMIYVWKADNTGVREVIYAEANSATEADTSDNTLVTFFPIVILSDINVQKGDRIVLEVMGYDNNTKTASYLHALNFDGALGSYRNSYIRFDQDLIFSTVLPFTQGIII